MPKNMTCRKECALHADSGHSWAIIWATFGTVPSVRALTSVVWNRQSGL